MFFGLFVGNRLINFSDFKGGFVSVVVDANKKV